MNIQSGGGMRLYVSFKMEMNGLSVVYVLCVCVHSSEDECGG